MADLFAELGESRVYTSPEPDMSALEPEVSELAAERSDAEPCDTLETSGTDEAQVQSQLECAVPRPPQRSSAGDSNSAAKKTDLQKSIELLRQRRLTQQRADRVLAEFADEEEGSEVTPIEQETAKMRSVDSSNGDAVSTEQEESYSPRIVW